MPKISLDLTDEDLASLTNVVSDKIKEGGYERRPNVASVCREAIIRYIRVHNKKKLDAQA